MSKQTGYFGKKGEYLLAGVLIFLIGAHLTLSIIEILYHPIFPWDAWLNWMYRAKAWFLSGEIGPMDPASLWADGGKATERYAVAGNHYPALLPLIAFAAASLIGSWSETLVNVPTISCAIGLIAGTYLICRNLGHSRLIALVGAYLVISTPLIGVHLSLAGMADIWMALTCGLGFGILFIGLSTQRSVHIFCGLLFIAISTQFKLEGWVWLIAALFIAMICWKPRLALFASAGVLLLTGLAWFFGLSQFELPVVGRAGFIGGRLYVPLLGSFALQQNAVADDYLHNFFLGGSWNLLWYVIVAGLVVSALRATRDRAAAVTLIMITVALGSQILIFAFTEQGTWADDWTAINRLPLHFVPAFIGATITSLIPPRWQQSHLTTAASRTALLTLCVLLATYGTATLLTVTLNDAEGAAVYRDGADLRAMQGSGRADRDSLGIVRFSDGVAVLSSGPVSVNPSLATLLRIQSSGSNRRNATFFWRDARDNVLHNVSTAGRGTQYLDLSGEEAWAGWVSEFGVVLYDDGGTVRLDSLALYDPTPMRRIDRVVTDWKQTSPWSPRSLNYLEAGNAKALAPLPLVLIGLSVLCIVLLALLSRRTGRPVLGSCVGVLLAAWLAGDVRWLAERSALAGETIQKFPPMSSEPLTVGDDRLVQQAVKRAICDLGSASPAPGDQGRADRLVIASDADSGMDFQLLRAKYHALPVAAHAHTQAAATLPVSLADRFLFLKLRFNRDNTETLGSEEAMRLLERRLEKPLRIAWESQTAFMIVSNDGASASASCWHAGN